MKIPLKRECNHWSDVQLEPCAPSRDLEHHYILDIFFQCSFFLFFLEKDKLIFSFYNLCKFNFFQREREKEREICECLVLCLSSRLKYTLTFFPGSCWHSINFLFVCLGFFVPLENFSLIWRRHVTIAGEGLQILTYALHFWPLSSEGYLASVGSWAVTTCLCNLGLLRLGFEHPTFRLGVNALAHCTAVAHSIY